ncbi:hypothetical protein AtDm6_2133 [Acetobacter tropicalis]|uniref:Uncharacterized protein n=1 Tax=Acetobacter tropicalis TaxID=104102 RepID=A0A094YMF5_9PROT|nr:hypothetical protein AtDm6_2133 [Acetobacter tropicalis]
MKPSKVFRTCKTDMKAQGKPMRQKTPRPMGNTADPHLTAL